MYPSADELLCVPRPLHWPRSDGSGRVLGTFAFYYREKRAPAAIEKAIVSACVNLCAIAIERDERVRERHRLAFTDELTSLGNRAAFVQKLDELARTSPHWGLLLIDIDNSKTVNDSLGHEAGDELIRVVARCIAATAPAGCSFRLGGDEFAVLLTAVDGQLSLDPANQILEAFRHTWGYDFVPRATIGGANLGVMFSMPRRSGRTPIWRYIMARPRAAADLSRTRRVWCPTSRHECGSVIRSPRRCIMVAWKWCTIRWSI